MKGAGGEVIGSAQIHVYPSTNTILKGFFPASFLLLLFCSELIKPTVWEQDYQLHSPHNTGCEFWKRDQLTPTMSLISPSYM